MNEIFVLSVPAEVREGVTFAQQKRVRKGESALFLFSNVFAFSFNFFCI